MKNNFMKKIYAVGLSLLMVASIFPSTFLETVIAETELVNVALNGTVSVSQITTDNGHLHGPEKINDGDTGLGSYWDSGILEVSKDETTAILTLDKPYDVKQIRLFNYWGKVWQQNYDRYYKYEIYTSLDGVNWTLSASKLDETPSTSAGDLYDIESDTKIQYVKVKCLESNNADSTIAHIVELQVFAQPEVDSKNIALNKSVNAGGIDANSITDGNRTGGKFWDGGEAPAAFTIDLEDYYDVDAFHVFPYVDGSRAYTYEIAMSDNGYNFEKVAEKKDATVETNAGKKFALSESKVARYVKVTMLSNTANASVHMREFEVYGKKHEGDYTPSTPTDPNGDGNIAFGKATRANTGKNLSFNVVDGDFTSAWSASTFPANVDVDLGKSYDLEDIEVYFPNTDKQYYKYSIYGSMDGVNFTRFVQKRDNELSNADGDVYALTGKTARYIRVNVEFVSAGINSYLSEVRVHGTESTKEAIDRPALNIPEFTEETITKEETIDEVYALIERRLGAEYKSWFTFTLEDGENDYFEITNQDGKIHIKGNKGVSLTSGLYHYLKYFCNVQITQQTDSVENMPKKVVPVKESVRKDTTFDVRYAYNYCTLSYTNAFYGQEEWLREIDWLALNGVNLVLDTTGQEAVWIEFLTSIGYSTDDAKAWLTGPAYTAWQFMSNMENYGGPIHDQYILDRLTLAKKNQRLMRALGMDVVLQGYAGMIPSDYDKVVDLSDAKNKEIADAMLVQGTWGGQFARPAMLKTDEPIFKEVAEKFYAAQKKVLGDITHYYAVDPFHEGGIKPSNLSEEDISRLVVGSMMEFDEEAIWIIQSWENNPTKGLLDGLGDNRQEHALILDLTSTTQPHYNNTTWGEEFYGTPWVYCMLDNFGDRPGVHGELPFIASDVNKAKENSQHMKGIGITPEGTKLNPVNYELFFETVWSDGEINIEQWIKDYVTRRYGTFNENAYDGWLYLLDSAYGAHGGHWGGVNSIANYRPDRGGPILGQNSSLPYDYRTFTKAIEKLLLDYETLSDSEGYLYDVAALLKQQLQNSQITYYNKFQEAYNKKDLTTFNENANKFLEAISLVDEISATQEDELLGNWIGKANDRSANYDDFTKDAFAFNAKALITTWGGRNSAKTLGDYAYRQYAGLEKDYVLPRWEKYVETLRGNLENGTNNNITYDQYFNDMWDFILDDTIYTRETTDAKSELARLAKIVMDEYTLYKDGLVIDDNVAINALLNASNGAGGDQPLSNLTDNDDNTLWVASNNKVPSSVTLDLGKEYPIYDIQIVFEKAPAIDRGLFIDFIVEAQVDGKWVEIATDATTREKQIFDYVQEDLLTARKVRVTITDIDKPLYPAIAEVRVFSSDGIQVQDIDLIEVTDTGLTLDHSIQTVADLKQYLYANVGEIKVMDAVKELADDAVLETGHSVVLVAKGVVVDEKVITVEEPVDKAALEEAIAEAEKLNKEDYTEISWKVFETAVANAKEVLANKNATQEVVNQAIEALAEAQENLELTVPEQPTDKDTLKELIENASKLNKDDYTADSWKVFETALANAKEVLADEEATEEMVKEAVAELEKASAQLEKKPTIEPEPDPEKPGEGEGNEGGTTPDTGDTTNATALLMVLIVAGGVLALLNKNKIVKFLSKK